MTKPRGSDAGIAEEVFFAEYGKAIDTGAAAVFAGAGLSRSASYVDWKDLLREFADELHLDIDIETDLPAVAQYHLNASAQVRSRLNQRLVDEFTANAEATDSHQILARLPIRTYWTTNYDRMIERVLEAQGKTVDVKVRGAAMTTSSPRVDVVLHKMHGDVGHPEGVIITRDDYDHYTRSHGHVLTALQADLMSKTFLFLGFSFTDPNLDFLLGRLRAAFGDSPRPQYTIMRRVQRRDFAERGGKKRYNYEINKQAHRVRDLLRYGIQTVLVDDYAKIPELLTELEKRYYRRSVFVSGAVEDPTPLGSERLDDLCRLLGTRIIADDYNLVSGFGLGIGSVLVMAALEQLYRDGNQNVDRRLKLRPFPQAETKNPAQSSRAAIWSRYRSDMISGAGFAVFIAGNKRGPDGPVTSDGMLEEFAIAQKQQKYPIPLAVTGWAAAEIWNEVDRRFTEIFPPRTPRQAFNALADPKATNDDLLGAVFELIHFLTPRPQQSWRRH